MVVYEFMCTNCGEDFEVNKMIPERNIPEPCPICKTLVSKSFSVPIVIGDTCATFNHALNKEFTSKSQMEKEAAAKGYVGMTSTTRPISEQLKEEKAKDLASKKAKKSKELHKHFEQACNDHAHLR